MFKHQLGKMAWYIDFARIKQALKHYPYVTAILRKPNQIPEHVVFVGKLEIRGTIHLEYVILNDLSRGRFALSSAYEGAALSGHIVPVLDDRPVRKVNRQMARAMRTLSRLSDEILRVTPIYRDPEGELWYYRPHRSNLQRTEDRGWSVVLFSGDAKAFPSQSKWMRVESRLAGLYQGTWLDLTENPSHFTIEEVNTLAEANLLVKCCRDGDLFEHYLRLTLNIDAKHPYWDDRSNFAMDGYQFVLKYCMSRQWKVSEVKSPRKLRVRLLKVSP